MLGPCYRDMLMQSPPGKTANQKISLLLRPAQPRMDKLAPPSHLRAAAAKMVCADMGPCTCIQDRRKLSADRASQSAAEDRMGVIRATHLRSYVRVYMHSNEPRRLPASRGVNPHGFHLT